MEGFYYTQLSVIIYTEFRSFFPHINYYAWRDGNLSD